MSRLRDTIRDGNIMTFDGERWRPIIPDTIKLNDELVYMDPSSFTIRANTSDGSDTAKINICGGGSASITRGGYIAISGNEEANTGSIYINAGDIAGGNIYFTTAGTTQGTINRDGQFLFRDGSAALPSLSFAGGSTDGIFSNGPGTVGISTSGSVRVSVSDAAVTFAPAVFAPAGSAASPAWSFSGDSNSGIYLSASDTVAVSAGGSQVATFSAPGITSTGVLWGAAGSAGSPTHAFTTAADTGIFLPSAGTLGISAGGSLSATISATDFVLSVGAFAPAGSASSPVWSYSADTDTGLYSIAPNIMGVSTGGTLRLTVSTAAITSTLPCYAPAGSAATPSWSISTDADTGLYSAGADQLGISVGGGNRITATTSSWTTSLVYLGTSGTVSNPGISFSTDNNTGIYRSAADTLGIVTGGVAQITWTTTTCVSALSIFGTAGSASVPAYSFSGDADSGIYSIGANNVGISLGGTKRVDLNDGTSATFLLPFIITPSASTGSPQRALTINAAAHTALTASTEYSSFVYESATQQFSTGALTTNRFAVIKSPTYSFVGASTLTNAATFAIGGAPVAGTNATITNSYALWVQSGISKFDGNISTTGDVSITTAGSGIKIKEGSNARLGTSTLVAGVVVVSNTSVTANTRVLLGRASLGSITTGVVEAVVTAGVGFQLTSSDPADDGVINWLLVEPA